MSRWGLTASAATPAISMAWEANLNDHVVRAAWSPDGSRLAAACIGGAVAVFDRDGRILYECAGHNNGTLALSWRADSSCFATGGQDSTACIWDAASGALLHRLDAGQQWVEQVSYSPQRDYLATGSGRQLRLWDGAGKLLKTYPPHPSTISDIQWQPGQLFFATASYGQLATFHPDSDAAVKQFSWKGSILVVAWSPDANFVATGNQDASVHFWYRKSGKDLEMSGYAAKIRELSWDSESRYLATGGSPVVIIWDCSGNGPAGSKPIQLDGHDHRPIRALAFQHKGKLLASGGQEGRVCLWRPQKTTQLLQVAGLGDSITQLAWSPDDRVFAAAAANGMLCVYRPEA
jgi:WD40 repeat protein